MKIVIVVRSYCICSRCVRNALTLAFGIAYFCLISFSLSLFCSLALPLFLFPLLSLSLSPISFSFSPTLSVSFSPGVYFQHSRNIQVFLSAHMVFVRLFPWLTLISWFCLVLFGCFHHQLRIEYRILHIFSRPPFVYSWWIMCSRTLVSILCLPAPFISFIFRWSMISINIHWQIQQLVDYYKLASKVAA